MGGDKNMTRAEKIRTLTDDELVDLLVWRTLGLNEVPECVDECEHFGIGCGLACPHGRKERAVRKWLQEEC
jgi:hypothetical protein